MLLVLGTLEVAFALYARNIVATSAHEAARAAVEIGRDPDSARAIARTTVTRAAGGLVHDLKIGIRRSRTADMRLVEVLVTGRMRPFGPVPLPIPLSARATAILEVPGRR